MEIKYFKDYELKQELQSIEQNKSYFEAHFMEKKLEFVVNYFEGNPVATLYFIDAKIEIATILEKNTKIEGRTIKFHLPKEQLEKSGAQEQVLFYSKDKEFQYAIKYWMDEFDQCVKEITLDAEGTMTYGQRFYFDTNNELRYSFEYDKNCRLFNCFDLIQGEPVRFDQLELSESEKEAYKTLN